MSLSKFEESTAAIERWASSPKPSGREGWIARAAEAPLILKIDAASRDVEGKTPVTGIALLKAAGLVNLLGPVEFGGAGETWETSYKITTEIAKADGSIGHLLGNHYSWFWSSQILGTAEQAKQWLREFTQGNYYLGGAVNPRGVISDVTVLEGVLEGTKDGAEDGLHAFAFVKAAQPGIRFKGDWDVIGQRLTEPGGCVIIDARVPGAQIAGFANKKLTPRDAYHSFILPPVQLQFAAVHLGVGIGALEAAAEYTRTITRAWPYDGDDKAKASEEWYILEGYGRLQAKLWAAVRVSKLIHAPREELTARARGEIAVQVAATKVTVIEISLEVGSKIFELVGVRGSLAKWGYGVC